jgi:hypothetical protein
MPEERFVNLGLAEEMPFAAAVLFIATGCGGTCTKQPRKSQPKHPMRLVSRHAPFSSAHREGDFEPFPQRIFGVFRKLSP